VVFNQVLHVNETMRVNVNREGAAASDHNFAAFGLGAGLLRADGCI
jgi:hypothetical protein